MAIFLFAGVALLTLGLLPIKLLQSQMDCFLFVFLLGGAFLYAGQFGLLILRCPIGGLGFLFFRVIDLRYRFLLLLYFFS